MRMDPALHVMVAAGLSTLDDSCSEAQCGTCGSRKPSAPVTDSTTAAAIALRNGHWGRRLARTTCPTLCFGAAIVQRA
jgi:hypothetical protein